MGYHALEKPTDGRMGDRLNLLDLGLRAIHEELKPIWRNSVILLISEFGRTVNVNGSGGTDHGTGTVALALGGPVSRRMVFARLAGSVRESAAGGPGSEADDRFARRDQGHHRRPLRPLQSQSRRQAFPRTVGTFLPSGTFSRNLVAASRGSGPVPG